ncbi:hypothetical protein V6Z12_D05G417000 [Gossypium hirsutum]
MAEYVAPAAVEIVADQAKEYASPYLRYFFRYGEIVEDFKNQRMALKLRKQRVDTHVNEAKRQTEIIYDDVKDWLRNAEKTSHDPQTHQNFASKTELEKPHHGGTDSSSAGPHDQTGSRSDTGDAAESSYHGHAHSNNPHAQNHPRPAMMILLPYLHCTKLPDPAEHDEFHTQLEYEAWVLFRDKAGLEDDCSTLNDVAKEVAAQCKGLPLAIVVVAKALKGESLNGWRDANQRFKDSTHLYDEEVLGGVLEPLNLSYDYLKKGINQMTGNHIQMCFLLCSLFPEDEEILTEILIMCGIGVGLFPYFYSIEEKRKKIVEALKKLQKSGLLLETDGADTIRIHDVIRDFAHWLTSTGENRFMVKDTYTAIALWNCSSIIKKIPDKVEFSKLKTLFLEGERKSKRDDFLVVFGTFFEEMKALQVLLLQRVSFSLKGFPSLPNLKTLCCHDCMLKNFSSSLTNMRSLEILSLTGTEIDEISEELVKLSALKYLRLSGVVEIAEELPNMVSRLTSLQELHVIPKNNLNLLELKSLSRLTALSLTLSTYQIPREDFVLPKLQRYAIVVGEKYSSNREAFIRRLDIQDFSSSLSAFNNLFCNVEELNLRNVGGQKNIVPSIDEMGVNELTSLHLESCNDLEFLIDTKNDQGSTVAFSTLVELNIESMVSLKGLCYGVSPTRFLQNLKRVIIRDCKELQVIFQIDKLSNLTELSLHSLPKLKRIWEVKPSHRAIASLQSLKVVRIKYCDNLKTIFSPCLALSMLHLQELYVRHCDRLEQVIGFGQEDEIIEESLTNLTFLELRSLPELKYHYPNLHSVKITECDEFTYLFSEFTARTLVHLKYLEIRNCNSLEHLIRESENMDEIDNHCWTKLKTLWIVDCQRLKYVFANTLSQGFPLLESVYLGNCPQLLQFFSSKEERDVIGDHILLNVPFLQDLEVSNCPQFSCFIGLTLSNVGNSRQLCNTDVPVLNEGCIVVGNHEEVFQVQGGYSFSSIKILELRNLFEVQIIWNDFAQVVTLENLTTLTLRDCKKLRYIFSLMMARSLSHLKGLFIEGCEEIERLILAKDQVSSSSSNGDTSLQPMSFPNLTEIVVIDCKNLSSLFPFGFAPVLPKLERLIVERNSKLEQVFELEEKVEVVAKEEMKFDKLKWLSLEELPGLIHFCPKGYHSVFP